MDLYFGYYDKDNCFHILAGPVSEKQKREIDRLIKKVEDIQSRIDKQQSV